MTEGGDSACGRCGTTWMPHHARGLCQACYAYQHRYGAPRPARLYRPEARVCRHCQTALRAAEGRECWACTDYRRRHPGTLRPERLWGRRIVQTRTGAA